MFYYGKQIKEKTEEIYIFCWDVGYYSFYIRFYLLDDPKYRKRKNTFERNTFGKQSLLYFSLHNISFTCAFHDLLITLLPNLLLTIFTVDSILLLKTNLIGHNVI